MYSPASQLFPAVINISDGEANDRDSEPVQW